MLTRRHQRMWLLCALAQQRSINFEYCMGGEWKEAWIFPLPCLSAHDFPSLLSSAHPSFNSYQLSAGLSRELASRWSWWKAALWAILSLPCARGVSLHLNESTKLTGSGRHLNKGVRARLSRLEFLCDSRRKHWGLIGGPAGVQPGFHHSFADAQNSTELEHRGLTEKPDRGPANTHRLDCSPCQWRWMWRKPLCAANAKYQSNQSCFEQRSSQSDSLTDWTFSHGEQMMTMESFKCFVWEFSHVFSKEPMQCICNEQVKSQLTKFC